MTGMQERRDSSSTILWLLGGIILGVILGLIAGWGVWPVSWTSALPQELAQRYKVDYVQMIAEAHVSTNDTAAAVARLEDLAGSPQAAVQLIETALDEIAVASPSSDQETNLRLNRLSNLSYAVGQHYAENGVVLDANGSNPPTAVPPTPEPQPVEAAAPTGSEDSSPFINPLTGAFWLILLAAILIAGGLVVAYRGVWLPRSTAQSSVFGSPPRFDDEIPGDGDLYSPPSSAQPSSLIPPPPSPDPMPEESGGYVFDDGYAENYQRRRPGQPLPPDLDPDALMPDGPVPDFEEDLPSSNKQLGQERDTTPSRPDPAWQDRPSRPTGDRPSSRLSSLTNLTERLSERFGDGGEKETQRPQPAPSVDDDKIFSPDNEGYFTAEFLAGDDFEEARSINKGREYLGEVGMAVSKLNTGEGAYAVSALEVWLFEKSQITTHTQHLLTPHLFQTGEWNRSQIQAEDPPPLLARAGLVFQLRGAEADLHCRITEVEYMASGPDQSAFRSLRLELVPRVH